MTLRDRRLLAVVTGGIVVFFVFSQLESMIPLYMKGQYGDRTEGISPSCSSPTPFSPWPCSFRSTGSRGSSAAPP